jgi:hypothetical protein
MVRALFLLSLLAVAHVAQAQQSKSTGNDLIRKGLFAAHFTIAPGWILSDGMTNIYLHGRSEFYLNRKVSIVGDGYYFLDTQGAGYLKHNHGVYFGANYHFPFKRFDPYIGLTPGVSFVQVANSAVSTPELSIETRESNFSVEPSISVAAGFNLYIWKFFHFMGQVRYVHANHATPWNVVYPLDEFRLSFGLGWNVNMIKAGKR